MSREGITSRNIPLVLALLSHQCAPLRERLLLALAESCSRQGGQVLVIELRRPDRVDQEGGLSEQLGDGNERIQYACLESSAHADMYVALDVVGGAPPRFDLVLLNVRSDAPEERFLASLAQRVLVLTEPGEQAQAAVRTEMEWLAGQHQQRRFTLAVDDTAERARHFYRQLLEESAALIQVECDLLEGLPAGLKDYATPVHEAVDAGESKALLETLWQVQSPIMAQGGLQLFWRCVMFCSECSLKACRGILASGKVLEACPVQRF